MIIASAPTRVDLAGGTIDVWPVCFALDPHAVTVNVAIDRRAVVRVAGNDSGRVRIRSVDRDERLDVAVGELTHDRLGLATRHVAHFGAGEGIDVEIESGVPSGSGLGGSSTIGVALAGALGRLREREFTLRTVQDIETALLRLPTGYQDYVAPLHGGCHAIHPVPGGLQHDPIPGAAAFFDAHVLLVDTQISHHSGMNNWEVVKRYLDGDATVVGHMNTIRDCALAMVDALTAGSVPAVADALNREWNARRELAPVVSNERIEAILSAGREAGALAGKVCGAGGGGCLILLADNPNDEALRTAIEGAGGAVLECRADPDGLRVETN